MRFSFGNCQRPSTAKNVRIRINQQELASVCPETQLPLAISTFFEEKLPEDRTLCRVRAFEL